MIHGEFRVISHPDIGDIRIYESMTRTAAAAAEFIRAFVHMNPQAVINYATGMTMIPVYTALAHAVAAGTVHFTDTTAFHLDERYPCQPSKPESFQRYITERVLLPLGISAGQAHLINGSAPDAAAEAKRYNEILSAHQLDISIIGFGPPPGVHIGFNESGTPWTAETHYTKLANETLIRDKNRGEEVIDGAITQGPKNIFSAKRIIGIAFGKEKGIGLKSALYGKISTSVVASGLRLPDVGPKTTLFIDEEAAKEFV